MPAAKKKPKAQPSSDREPQLSRFQAFTMRQVPRREISGAVYNPRILSDSARKTLKKVLDRDHGGVGLLGPVTVNARNMRLVGGHMRLSLIDALEGHDNYLLDVAMVDLSDKQEIEANLVLNNASAQGDWDLDLLGVLLKTPDLDLAATGWTPLDISITFAGDDELAGMFGLNEPTASLLAEVQSMQDDGKPPPKPKREIMKETRAKNEEAFADDDTEIYAVVTFLTRSEREIFMHHCGADSNDRYIDGSLVVAKMGAELEATMRAAAPKPKPEPAKPAKKKPAKK